MSLLSLACRLAILSLSPPDTQSSVDMHLPIMSSVPHQENSEAELAAKRTIITTFLTNSNPLLERATVTASRIACLKITSLCSESNDWSSS